MTDPICFAQFLAIISILIVQVTKLALNAWRAWDERRTRERERIREEEWRREQAARASQNLP